MSDLQMAKPWFRHRLPPATLHVSLPMRNTYLSLLINYGDKYIHNPQQAQQRLLQMTVGTLSTNLAGGRSPFGTQQFPHKEKLHKYLTWFFTKTNYSRNFSKLKNNILHITLLSSNFIFVIGFLSLKKFGQQDSVNYYEMHVFTEKQQTVFQKH